jgi:branched-chain amino acid transport system ATP-binding protein
VLTQSLFENLATIAHEEGMTVLLVEQNANLALRLADYAYVLEGGRIELSGDGEHMREEEAVRHAYLGT